MPQTKGAQMSTISETISVLEEYNKWRRGDETISMPDPFEVGVAIGDAVRLLRELAAERERVRRYFTGRPADPT